MKILDMTEQNEVGATPKFKVDHFRRNPKLIYSRLKNCNREFSSLQ